MRSMNIGGENGMTLFTKKDKEFIHGGVDILIRRLEKQYEQIDCPAELVIELRLYDNKENCIEESTSMSAFEEEEDGHLWDEDY